MGIRLLFLCLLALAESDFSGAVLATHPVAFYRMDFLRGRSMTGVTEYSAKGGVKVANDGAPIGMADNGSVVLDGSTGYLSTTQTGGIGTSASIMVWVNLASLPSAEHIFCVAQSGDALGLQFEKDGLLKFFAASGSALVYRPERPSLVNQWHMIVATVDAATRTIYWDGKPVASDRVSGLHGEAGPFTLGRFFHGGLDEVALWNRALKESEVSAIFATTSAAGSPHD